MVTYNSNVILMLPGFTGSGEAYTGVRITQYNTNTGIPYANLIFFNGSGETMSVTVVSDKCAF